FGAERMLATMSRDWVLPYASASHRRLYDTRQLPFTLQSPNFLLHALRSEDAFAQQDKSGSKNMHGHAEVQSGFFAIVLDLSSQLLDSVPRALRRGRRRAALVFLVALAALPLFSQAQTVVIGTQQIQPQSDSNTAGLAEAFMARASASG